MSSKHMGHMPVHDTGPGFVNAVSGESCRRSRIMLVEGFPGSVRAVANGGGQSGGVFCATVVATNCVVAVLA